MKTPRPSAAWPRALGSKASGCRGAILCICAEEPGRYFPVVLQEGCHGIIVGASCDRTEAAICFSASPRMEKRSLSLAVVYRLQFVHVPSPISEQKEQFLSFPRNKSVRFLFQIFPHSQRREGGSQLSPTQEISFLEGSLSSLPSTALFSEASVKLSELAWCTCIITASSS